MSMPIFQRSIYQSRMLLLDELSINRKVYGGNKRVVNEFPATYPALREVSVGYGRVEGTTCGVRSYSSERGAKWVIQRRVG